MIDPKRLKRFVEQFITCPVCTNPMHEYNVTCRVCYGLTNRLIPGTYFMQGGARRTITEQEITGWVLAKFHRFN